MHGSRTASRGSTSEGWKNVVPKEQQEDPLHAFGINLFKLCFNVGVLLGEDFDKMRRRGFESILACRMNFYKSCQVGV